MMEPRETSSAIEAAAIGWVAKLDRGPLSENESAALDAWLTSDSRRRGAFARAQAVMALADRSRALRQPDSLGWDARKYFWRWPSIRAERWPRVAVVACIALLIGWAALPGAETIATQRGEIRMAVLSDGSRATLDTKSNLVVRFQRSRRDVELLEGTALFDVAKDRERPFVVHAGPIDAIAVGTSFSVTRDRSGEAVVTVREGRVAIRDRKGRITHILTANMTAKADDEAATSVAKLTTEDVNRELAWRSHMIALDGDTLTEAAEKFARYGGPPIVIADKAVGSRTLSGWFAADDPRGFARAAALSLGVRAREKENSIIIE
ncbi:DUF4880 domain-containing protein [Sphingopyxis sp. YF1]|uniref:FecR family protein n=1 Tax=unclassified Sphingopyxis TaxID=2614943 RepID=UPI001F60FA7B|nr:MULTISPECIES: FecR domain-containing protein [unclassified Sphingopyxis]UNU44611.1 DUF4880 domain-containing protein [Sphingopyxis sp. YF1]USI76651.1 FecR domain-containing protein [Sphingopyxis sp. USTB-05]